MASQGRQRLVFAATLGLVAATANGAEPSAKPAPKLLAEPVGIRLEPIGSATATDDPVALAGLVLVLQSDPNEQHRLAAVEQMLRVPAPAGMTRNLLTTVSQQDPSIWVRLAAEQACKRLEQMQTWDVARQVAPKANDPWVRSDRPVETYRRALFQLWKTQEESTQQFPETLVAQANQQPPEPAAPKSAVVQHIPKPLVIPKPVVTPNVMAAAATSATISPASTSAAPNPTVATTPKAPADKLSGASAASNQGEPSSKSPALSSGVKQVALPKYVEQLSPEERQLVEARMAAFKDTPYSRSLLPEIPESPAAKKQLAKQLMTEARGLVAKQKLDEAENILYKLREFAADYGYFEYSPESLERDIARARARQQGNSIPGVFQKFHR